MAKINKLKPCPFCGTGNIKLKKITCYDVIYFCECPNCASRGPMIKNSLKSAVKAWNRRADNG